MMISIDEMLADYRVTSVYGPRIHPITGASSIHTGVDMAKAHQSPVLAFIPGTVVEAYFHNSYGNHVIVKDKSANTQVYAHLDSISVKKGDKIELGQEIGRQGTTGSSTGSHLHYEVRIDGLYAKHTDPIAYTKRYWVDNKPSIAEPDVGATTIEVNGYKLKGLIVAGVSMVPVASIAKALSKEVSWNKDTKTVVIK